MGLSSHGRDLTVWGGWDLAGMAERAACWASRGTGYGWRGGTAPHVRDARLPPDGHWQRSGGNFAGALSQEWGEGSSTVDRSEWPRLCFINHLNFCVTNGPGSEFFNLLERTNYNRGPRTVRMRYELEAV